MLFGLTVLAFSDPSGQREESTKKVRKEKQNSKKGLRLAGLLEVPAERVLLPGPFFGPVTV